MKKEKSHLQHIADASYKRAILSVKKKQSLKDQAIDIANKREYARKYYQAHKDKSRAYYRANSAKIKERAMVWRVANRERYLEQQAEYDRTQRLHRVRDKKLDQYIIETAKKSFSLIWSQGIADRIKALKRP
ncbi:hypothetical protein LCGC14_1259040 [marine sediment metagenome]|uniref:Uncharacterized protein n=1 Tax=marine sediment metagenome TaxID=412755 RepID=A0A0F9P4M1_9ZZZZ